MDGEPLGKSVLGDIDGSKEEIEILFGSFVVIGDGVIGAPVILITVSTYGDESDSDGVIGAPVIGASVIIIGCMDATI